MTALPINNRKNDSVTARTSIFVTMDIDMTLIKEVKDGNELAFKRLFDTYYIRLCHFAFQFVHNMPDAEELVQDTFVNIWEKRAQIKIESSFKSYIYNAVKNRGLNNARGEQRRKNYYAQHDKNRLKVTTAEEELQYQEVHDKLFEGMEALPRKCKKIFQMSRLEGLKHKEIASKMDIKVKTVENQIGIALKYLKKHLSEFLHFIAWLFIGSNF